MANIEFTLSHGLPFGQSNDAELQYDVVLRELTTRDVIEARTKAEQVVFVPDPQTGAERGITVVSEVRMGIELLCRQIESIGEIKGPLPERQLYQLHVDDFALLNEQAERLDAAVGVAEKRGRLEQSGSRT